MENAIFSKIKRGQVIPEFRLKNIFGRDISSDEFLRRNNLIILFVNKIEDECCGLYLGMLNGIYEDLKRIGAEILVISQQDRDLLKEFTRSKNIGFNILIDQNGGVINKFTYKDKDGNNIGALFITDKYNSLYKCYLHRPFGELPETSEIISSIEFLEKQCPECGVGSENEE